MQLKRLTLGISLVLVTACTKFGFSDKKSDDSDESAIAPVAVNGTYFLSCEELAEADAKAAFEIGCAVRDVKEQKKIELKTIASEWVWSYQEDPASPAGVIVEVVDLKDDDATYHVRYRFNNPSRDTAREYALKTRIQADYRPTPTEAMIHAFEATVANALAGPVESVAATNTTPNESLPK